MLKIRESTVNIVMHFAHYHLLTYYPSEWLASNFSLQYQPWIRHKGDKNKWNDHPLKRLDFQLNYPCHCHKQCIENNIENLHADFGVWRLRLFCNFFTVVTKFYQHNLIHSQVKVCMLWLLFHCTEWKVTNLLLSPIIKTHLLAFSYLNPSNPNISIHILHTVLYTFPKKLTERLCSTIKGFFSSWSFPLFSWP